MKRSVVDSVTHHDVVIWLIVACVVLVIATYEIAALTLPGWHTISYFSYYHPAVRILVGLLFVLALAWWIVHSGHPHPV